MRLEEVMIRDGIIKPEPVPERKTDGESARYIIRLARDVKFLSLVADGHKPDTFDWFGQFNRFGHLVNNKGACRAKIRVIMREIQRKLDYLHRTGIISPSFSMSDVVERGRKRDSEGWGEVKIDDYIVVYTRNYLTKIVNVRAK